jgi:hypothetical protein
MNTHSTRQGSRQFGNSAVDGLIAGAGGGMLMIIYLLLVMALLGEAPAVLLQRFTTGTLQDSTLTGVVAHLAVSAIYGMVFALVWRLFRQRTVLLNVSSGMLYGLLLFLAAEYVLLPAVQSPLLEIPALHFGIAHIFYGLTLGYFCQSIVHTQR